MESMPVNDKARTLSLLGGSSDDADKLGRLLAARPDSAWRTGPASNADVLIVDVDSVYGHMDWLKAQSSGRIVIALSAGDAPGAEHRLRKPVTPATLFELLDQVAAPAGNGHAAPGTPRPAPASARAAAVAAPSAPVEPPLAARPAPEPAVMARPATAAPAAAPEPAAAAKPRTLLELLAAGGRWRLQRDGQQTLFLDGSTQLAHARDTGLKALATWCSHSLGDAAVEMLETSAFAAATRGLTSLPYARLTWLAHLVGSDGQLEAGLDAGARYKLARWPQVERDFPKHFRIATAMMKAAGTVEEIAEASGAPLAEVANFINAYHSSGHIEVDGAAGRRSH